MKKVYTTGQVAKILNLNINTIIKWFDDGKLKGFKLPDSNDRRITAESLMGYMKENDIPLNRLDKQPLRKRPITKKVKKGVKRTAKKSR